VQSSMQCISLIPGKSHVDSIDQLLLLLADAVKEADAQPEDVAITMNGTQDASKLGRHTALGESSSSSSSSSSDGQPDGLYAGKPLPSSYTCGPTSVILLACA
jgi:hypothetical protein